MDYDKLLLLAKPYLMKNDFGIAHTQRVLEIASKNFKIPSEKEELIFCSIILHDIGGSTIKDQYQKGPIIATELLRQLGYNEKFIEKTCQIISTHHEHLENPSTVFQILYDSDKLVMFSPEEFSYYNSKPDFNWKKIIEMMYSKNAKKLAKKILEKSKNNQ